MKLESRPDVIKHLNELRVPGGLIAGVGLLVLLALLFGGPQTGITITEMLIRMIVVVGIYVFVGNSGVISFGHIGFMALGAYAAVWSECDPNWKELSLPNLPDFLRSHQYPFFVGFVGGGILVALVALIFGAAILRLSGLAASIATFAFLMLLYNVCSNWDSVTGGHTSLVGIPTLIGPGFALLGAALSIVAAYAFQRSRIGLMLRATREDPIAASASSVDVLHVRLWAWLLSALIVGAGGYLYANFLGVITIETFYIDLTFLTLTMLVVGGTGSLSGAVVGVVVVSVISELLRVCENGFAISKFVVGLPLGSEEIVLGIVMIFILIMRPSGIMGSREIRLPWGASVGRAAATK
jgi:branched-chain amino acid transport system permease protein